jgi:hypothetical protein
MTLSRRKGVDTGAHTGEKLKANCSQEPAHIVCIWGVGMEGVED